MTELKSSDVVGATALALSAFGFFMPDVNAVRKGSVDRHDIRVAEGVSAFALIGSGLMASAVSGDWTAVTVTTFAAVMFVAMYEFLWGADV